MKNSSLAALALLALAALLMLVVLLMLLVRDTGVPASGGMPVPCGVLTSENRTWAGVRGRVVGVTGDGVLAGVKDCLNIPRAKFAIGVFAFSVFGARI